jgi:hypothetical protein
MVFFRTHAAPHSVLTHSLLRLLGLTSIHNSREEYKAALMRSAKFSPGSKLFLSRNTVPPAASMAL